MALCPEIAHHSCFRLLNHFARVLGTHIDYLRLFNDPKPGVPIYLVLSKCSRCGCIHNLILEPKTGPVAIYTPVKWSALWLPLTQKHVVPGVDIHINYTHH